MIRWSSLVILLMSVLPAFAQPPVERIIVRFRASAAAAHKQQAHTQARAQVLRRYRNLDSLEVVQLPSGADLQQVLAAYRRDPAVLYAEPDQRVSALATPNDPRYGELWGMPAISAPEAWNLTTGSASVVVGIIDTGVDYTHPDLAANMFRNEAECDADGVDDDANGWVDDCYGIDTVNLDGDPRDDHAHGTHVAGTIGGVGNNGVGVAGVNWTVKMAACKFLDSNGSGWLSDAIVCLDYFAWLKQNGVNVVATNNSWGTSTDLPETAAAIPASASFEEGLLLNMQEGILFVAAAGNGGHDGRGDNLDNPERFPNTTAQTYVPNIIVASAFTADGAASRFSNFGAHTAHIFAPGSQVLSTVPTFYDPSGYRSFNGTSMATPHVTGVVALLKAFDPALTWYQLRNLIVTGGTPAAVGAGTTISGRTLNAFGSMTCTDSLVQQRLWPRMDIRTAVVGQPINLAALSVRCADPAGPASVAVSGGPTVDLLDDGNGFDGFAGDGIFSGQWTPSATGTYTLEFPGGDVATIAVVAPYTYTETTAPYRDITGTALQLDPSNYFREITPPFPLHFGGASFTSVYPTSTGTLSFGVPQITLFPEPLPNAGVNNLITPFWTILDANNNGPNHTIYWQVIGTAPNRELVIEWRDVFISGADRVNENMTFQVVLFEGSDDILFNYADVIAGGATAAYDNGARSTVGIQSTEDVATMYSYRSPLLANGSSILWTIPADPTQIPRVSAIAPGKLSTGDSDATVVITGSNFAADAVARWVVGANLTPLATTVDSPTQLTVTVHAAQRSTPATVRLTVMNPGKGESNALNFVVEQANISYPYGLQPSRTYGGAQGFTMVVIGEQFQPGAEVLWNGNPRTTTFVNSGKLTATIPASDLTNPGFHSVQVRQAGVFSWALTFTVAGFDVVIPTGSSATVNAGSSATYQFQVSPEFAPFNNNVNLACAGNLPRGVNCSFAPAAVTPGGGAAEVTLTVSTQARTSASLNWPGLFGPAPLVAMTLFAPLAFRRRRLLLGMVLFAVMVLASCGGGGSSSFNTPPPTTSGTPPGTYTVNVTATSGGLSESGTVTLVVR